MLRIAICDDERSELNTIQGFLDGLKEYYPGIVYDAYFSGEMLLEHYKRAKMEDYYDIILMDIEMGKCDGLSTAAEIRKIDENPLLIYITKYDEYVYKSFETDPFNYLLKPVTQEHFAKVFKNAVEKLKKKDHTYAFYYNYEWVSVYINEIIYLESKSSKSNVSKITMHTTDGDYEYNATLKEACKELEKHDFVKSHGSFLINMAYIKRLKYDTALLRNGVTVPVSPAFSKVIKEAFTKFNVRRCDL